MVGSVRCEWRWGWFGIVLEGCPFDELVLLGLVVCQGVNSSSGGVNTT